MRLILIYRPEYSCTVINLAVSGKIEGNGEGQNLEPDSPGMICMYTES